MRKQDHEDKLCNQLIDLYLKEKEIMGRMPDPMPVHQHKPLLLMAALPACALPSHPLVDLDRHIVNSIQLLQENTQTLLNNTEEAAFWVPFGIVGALSFAASYFLNSNPTLRQASQYQHGSRFSPLLEIDLKRYALTIENPDIFDIPHYRYPDTPKRYNALHA